MQTKKLPIGEAFSFGWEKVKENTSLFLPVVLIFILLSASVDIIEYFFTLGAPISLVLNIASIVLSIFLTLGFVRICLDVYHGKKPEISDLFSQGSLLVPALIAYLIYVILVFAGFLALLIPGIYLMLRLFFFDYFIVDKKMDGVQALKQSWKVMKGNNLRFFLFVLLAVVVNIIGAMLLVVGLLFTVPTTYMAMVYFYKKLTEEEGEEEQQQEQEEPVGPPLKDSSYDYQEERLEVEEKEEE